MAWLPVSPLAPEPRVPPVLAFPGFCQATDSSQPRGLAAAGPEWPLTGSSTSPQRPDFPRFAEIPCLRCPLCG